MLIRPHLSPADNRRIQAMLFGNQNGDLRQQLLDGAPFLAELTHTAVPQRAAPGTTATFTRATTATVGDNEGVLRTAIAGEARFEGARRVHNLINTTDSSEVMSVNDITSYPITITPSDIAPPSGYTQADRQATTGALGRKGALTTWSTSVAAGRVLLMQCVAKAGSGRYLVFGDQADSNWHVMTLDTQTGTVNVVGDAFSPGVEDLGDGWFKIWFRFTKNIAGGVNMLCCHSDAATNGAYPFINAGEYWWATGFQCEDITGRTDQTTPSEYVSVGVLSAPYHGSGVDGVKCFNTDLDGNPIADSINTGYVAEGARTNLCLQSQTFGTTWVPSATTVSSDAVVAPDGTTTADKIVETIANANHGIAQTITFTAAAHTMSVYAKKGERDWLWMNHNATGAYKNAYFNLATGTIGTVDSGWTAAISDAGNGWYRCSITFTATAAAISVAIFNTTADGGSAAYVGDITKGTYLWGAQVELGSFASSYIATTTIAVARNADVLTYPSAGNIDGTVGWAYCETNLGFIDAATNNWMITRDNDKGLLYSNGTDGQIVVFDGVQGAVKSGLSTLVGTYTNCASTWGGGSQSVTANGAAPATAAFDGDMSPTTTIDIGANSTGNLWGTIRNVRIGQRQLSSSELQAVTR